VSCGTFTLLEELCSVNGFLLDRVAGGGTFRVFGTALQDAGNLPKEQHMNQLNLKKVMATFAFGMCLIATFAAAAAPPRPSPAGPTTDPIHKICPQVPCGLN
jgi:hypothetical protein